MQDPGARRLFVARHEFKEIRRAQGKQTKFVTRGLSASTLSRIERGASVIENTARAALQQLAPGKPFETLFELAPGRDAAKNFTWEQISRSAAQVGRKIFKEFKPDFIITFAGPPALFTSLAMMKTLTREDFLRTRFYTALYRNKGSSFVPLGLEGYETIESLRFVLHVPRLVGEIPSRSKKRVCVIECTVTTGSVLETLRKHLVAKGYQRRNIRYACCVCARDTYAESNTRPDYCTYKSQGKYRLPWGEPL
jgi:hypothetical protein